MGKNLGSMKIKAGMEKGQKKVIDPLKRRSIFTYRKKVYALL
jgi:hypothetical protein